jgi:pimeloyl-ACP methyl ester carboxylesterase
MEGQPPIVLLHAFPLTSAMWRPQVESLSDRWHVVTPDLPAMPTMDGIADAVAAHIRDLGLPPVVLGGLSMGGYVTFALLRRHPELVRAVVLADTRAGADTPEVRQRRTNQQAQVASEGVEAIVEGALDTLPSAHTRQDRPDVMGELRGIMETVAPAWVTAALEAMKGRPDSTPLLDSLDKPALVIVGEDDEVTPPEVAADMERRLPNARLAVIPKAGHLSNLEEPDAFNAELRSFLETLP